MLTVHEWKCGYKSQEGGSFGGHLACSGTRSRTRPQLTWQPRRSWQKPNLLDSAVTQGTHKPRLLHECGTRIDDVMATDCHYVPHTSTSLGACPTCEHSSCVAESAADWTIPFGF
jgi:hypothetical protein